MFKYCVDKKSTIFIAIGNFLSHIVIWEEDDGTFVKQQTVNKWDRMYLAKAFYQAKYNSNANQIGGKHNEELFLKEVAIKIDELIPKRYFVKYHQDISNKKGSLLQQKFLGKENHEETKDLIYIFSETENRSLYRPKNFKDRYKGESEATEKQKAYLFDLLKESGYMLIDEKNLTKTNASLLISFLNGTGEEPKNLFELISYI